jgi:hypothetical protein
MMMLNMRDVRLGGHFEIILNRMLIVSKQIAGKNDVLRRLVIHIEKKMDLAIFRVTPLIILIFRS